MKKLDKEEAHYFFSNYIFNRNKDNFEMLYNEYKSVVYAISFSILKNREDSNDVVQNVFLKIYTMNINQLPQSYELSWLYTVTKNESINLLRKKRNSFTKDSFQTVI